MEKKRSTKHSIFRVIIMLCVIFFWKAEPAFTQDNNDDPNAKILNSSENLETRLSISLAAQVYPKALGGESIAVFYDRADSNLDLTKLRRVRFFVLPYFFPKLSSFSSEVSSACKLSEADAKSSKTSIRHIAGYNIEPAAIVEVPLNFEVASGVVNRQIVDALNVEFGISSATKKISRGQLHPYPFSSLHVVAGMRRHAPDRPMQELYRFPVIPEILASDIIQSRAVSFPTRIATDSVIVSGNCNNLADAAYYRDLWAYVLTPFDRVTRNSAEVVYSAFFNSQGFLDILSDETQTGGVSTARTSEGKGFVLNFGIGGTSGENSQSNVRAIDSRRRAVSGDILSSAALKFAASAYSRIITEDPKAEDLFTQAEIANRALQLVNGLANTVTVELKRLDDGRIAYLDGATTRYIGAANEKILLKGNSAPDQSASSETSFVDSEGGTTKVTNGFKHKDMRSVSWIHDGSEWVPTSIDLKVVSRNMGQGTGGFGVSSSTAIRSSQQQLVMLPRILQGGSNDIGPNLPRLEPKKLVIEFGKNPISTTLTTLTGTVKKDVSNNVVFAEDSRTSRFSATCSAIPQPPAGYIRVGGELIEGNDFPQTCLPSAVCNQGYTATNIPSWAEQAVDTKLNRCTTIGHAAGCLVNREWYEWYELSNTGETKFDQATDYNNWKQEMCNAERISDQLAENN